MVPRDQFLHLLLLVTLFPTECLSYPSAPHLVSREMPKYRSFSQIISFMGTVDGFIMDSSIFNSILPDREIRVISKAIPQSSYFCQRFHIFNYARLCLYSVLLEFCNKLKKSYGSAIGQSSHSAASYVALQIPKAGITSIC